jgi:glycosyl transferase family 87
MSEPRHLAPVLRTLENRGFRLFVLAAFAIPLLLGWFWQTFLQPILLYGSYDPGDFHVYMGAAWALVHGQDPYLSFLRSTVPDPAFNRGYIYPPFLAWALQPVAGLQGAGLDIAQLVVLQISLLFALWLLIRSLRIRDRQLQVLVLALSFSWYPVRFDLGGQVNLVLLALVVVWLAAYLRGDDWWGGAALGLSIAIKLMTAPLLVVLAWGRRWIGIVASVVTVVVLWAIASPQFLVEYVVKVAPSVAGGSGFRENQTPTALISRVLDPPSFYGQTHPMSLPVRSLSLVVAIAVVLVTWRFLGARARRDRAGRALEAAAVLAALPLCVGIQTPSQYVTVVIAIVILLQVGIAQRDSALLVLLGVAYVLSGPVHQGFLAAISNGVSDHRLLEPWAEISGVVPLTMFWLGSLLALRRYGALAEGDRLASERITKVHQAQAGSPVYER